MRRLALCSLAAALLAACSSSPPSADASTADAQDASPDTSLDATPTDVAGDLGTPPDVAVDRAAPPDTGLDAPSNDTVNDAPSKDTVVADRIVAESGVDAAMPADVAITCETLPGSYTYVGQTAISGPAPAHTGGALPDGDYVLTAIHVHGASTSVVRTASRLRLTMGSFQWTIAQEGVFSALRAGGTYTRAGTSFLVMEQCLGGGAITFPYSSAGATLRIGKNGISPSMDTIEVYTRQ